MLRPIVLLCSCNTVVHWIREQRARHQLCETATVKDNNIALIIHWLPFLDNQGSDVGERPLSTCG